MAANREFSDLPEEHPACLAIIDHMDALLNRAALIRPATDHGYAVKAQIAQVYGDCTAGARVQLHLLADLMTRGRA